MLAVSPITLRQKAMQARQKGLEYMVAPNHVVHALVVASAAQLARLVRVARVAVLGVSGAVEEAAPALLLGGVGERRA